MRRIVFLSFSLLLPLAAQTLAAQSLTPEARTSQAYDAAKKAGPLALHSFLTKFPKGADLHVHLTGAVYAENYIRQAGEDGLCVDPARLSFAKPPCAAPLVDAAKVPADQPLYDRLINSFSMRSFVPTPGWSGHDQFFATFARFGGLNKSHEAEWIDEVASRSAAQNQQYLEIMDTPPYPHAWELAQKLPLGQDFAAYRKQLLDAGLRDEVALDRDHLRSAMQGRNKIENCGTAQAAESCKVEVRYIYQILRGHRPEEVFAQTLLGFETVAATLADHEPGFIGLNFVMPEDGYLSMRDYELQMKMLDYLHGVYPQVPISLHAGELAPGLVPPEGMRFHIRQAVELGHALRIGHGVDVLYEDDAPALLREMAARHVMVEINLSSNEGILGIKGAQHPFPLYRATHVPVALSTDDEGVSRIELTGEYTRAALDYNLSYRELKELARTGMEHNFLSGASLWATADGFGHPVAACAADQPGSEKPSPKCAAFLVANEKAKAQWEQERRFAAFEAGRN